MSIRLAHRAVCRLALAVACVAAVVGTAARGLAVDYTWGSATTGGSWSVTTNWNPNGAPTSGDTATLANATANRTVFYNSAASGSLTGLTFTQTTSGILNELRVQRNLAVTDALVLGASSGTAQLNIAGTTGANITGTFSGGITVNSGGVLALANFNPVGNANTFNANLTGNVTVSGGRLDFSWIREGSGTSSANSNQVLTGNLTMSSGTIAFDNNLGTNPDRRLQITGDVSITGGRFTTNNTTNVSNLRFDGASTVFAPASYDSARFQSSLQRTGDQTYTGSTAIQTFIMRGTGIKTVSNSGTISTLQMMDADGTGRSATTLKLGSNLTVGSGGLVRAGFGDTGTTLDYGVNADIYTLDLTAASGAWTPTTVTGTVAQWALTGTAGRIIANGFNLATANVGTSVGPGLILESRAGNSVANTLSLGTSGTGAIDATSVFRYAGAAAVATPSTLTSSRAIGILEVTSGALQVSSLPSLAGARVNGGVLIATSSSALPGFGSAGFVTFGGGTLQLPVDGTAWTMSQVDTIFANATKTSGALAIDVASGVQTQTGSGYSGSIGLTKLGSGTLVLSAANTYAGPSTVSAGMLRLDNASALGNTTNALAVNGGTLDLNGNSVSVGPLSGASGGVITTSNAAGTATLTTSVAAGSSTFGGVIQDNGSGRMALTKLGSGTLALAAVNTFTGTTSVDAGTLQVGVSGTAGRVTGDTLVNTGGRLLLANVSGTLGNVTVAGGRLDLTAATASINGLSMTSGTVGLGNTNLRLSVFGNSSITGGSVVEPGPQGVINFYGATNVFAPQTFNTGYSFQLHASGDQTFSGSTALGAVRVRGTGIKTVSNSGSILNISFINDTAGSPVTLKLGSNLTTGAGGMNLADFSQQGTALAFGVDADTYTLDLSAASGAWTPGTGGTGTTALWTLAGTAGRIIANGFNLGSARVDSSVGPGLILESRAGDGVANTLSVGAGSGTIDPTSVFRYAGTAAVATPSTLTSSRAIGDLEVTSGALRISSLAGLQNLRVTGGTLDLGNQSLSVTSGSFGGGSVTSGTLTSTTFLATSGSVAASLAGVGGTLTKTTAGTFTLAGVNTYTGATTIAGGILALDAGGSFANSSSIIVGNVGSSGAVLDLTAKTGSFDIGAGQTLGGGGTVQLASSGTLNVLGLLSPGNSPGLLTFDAGTTLLSGTTLMEIWGTSRATTPSHGDGFYDAINVIDSGVLTFGGLLQLSFDQTFSEGYTFNLFTPSGSGSLAGNFSNVAVVGSFYNTLTWSQDGTKWKSSETGNGESFEFDSGTGNLTFVVVPEPGALALAGIGIAAAAWVRRRRRS